MHLTTFLAPITRTFSTHATPVTPTACLYHAPLAGLRACTRPTSSRNPLGRHRDLESKLSIGGQAVVQSPKLSNLACEPIEPSLRCVEYSAPEWYNEEGYGVQELSLRELSECWSVVHRHASAISVLHTGSRCWWIEVSVARL